VTRCGLTVAVGVLAAAGCSFLSQGKEVATLAVSGESRDLRDGKTPRSALTERRSRLLVIAIDGVERALLYDMLRTGELPGLSALVGGTGGGGFPHAAFAEDVLAVLPSSTIPGWASLFTGVPPAVHGLVNNEVFIRDRKELAAPAPVSFKDVTPALQCYTEDYADNLLDVPTIYEQMRASDGGVKIWVSMSQFHRGADRLLMARRTVIASAFQQFLQGLVGDSDDEELLEKFSTLDGEAVDTVIDQLDDLADREPLPDVLTIYLPGTDLFAHLAKATPDRARRLYLRKVVDGKLLALHRKLSEKGGLDDRFVVVVSDHGHTDVIHDDRHALGSGGEGEPPDVLGAAGFRVRPREWKVDHDDDFQAALAYGGAMAFLYLADRSQCATKGAVCDFRVPARFEEDVVPAAEAFLRSSRDGEPVSAMRGTIDLVLARRPVAAGETPHPFQVYVGHGKLEEVSSYLAREPRRGYVRVAQRLRELAVGPHGGRAGDILLIARDGAERQISDRFYFSGTYESWHGSPARKDSEVPFILAHQQMSSRQLAAIARASLGDAPELDDVGRLLVELRLRERR
jgi:predicted AlkP superfamily pyrophosphatase or phosphodiesterase